MKTTTNVTANEMVIYVVWFVSSKPLNPFTYEPSLSVCMICGKPGGTKLDDVGQTATGLSNVW